MYDSVIKGGLHVKKKAKVALTVGAAGVAAWAASRAMVKRSPRENKTLFERFNQLHFTNDASDGRVAPLFLTKEEQLVTPVIIDGERATLLNAHTWIERTEEMTPFESLLRDHPYYYVSIEQAPNTYEGSLMPSKLWHFIETHQLTDRIIVTSRFDEQLERFNLYAQNNVAFAASEEEMVKAYAAYTSTLGHLYKPTADCFVFDEKSLQRPLVKRGFLDFLRKLNIKLFVHRSTFNEEQWEALRADESFDGWIDE